MGHHAPWSASSNNPMNWATHCFSTCCHRPDETNVSAILCCTRRSPCGWHYLGRARSAVTIGRGSNRIGSSIYPLSSSLAWNRGQNCPWSRLIIASELPKLRSTFSIRADARIGLISGPLAWWEARERYAGWRDTLLRAGLQASSSLVVNGDWTAASGEQGMRKLLEQQPDVDAVFACNDQMALGALGVAHQLGRRIPQDLGDCWL